MSRRFRLWVPDKRGVWQTSTHGFRIVVGVCFGLLGYWLYSQVLTAEIEETRHWARNAEVSVNEPQTGLLFNDMVKHGLLRLDPVSFTIQVPPSDLVLLRKAQAELAPQHPSRSNAGDPWPEKLNEEQKYLLDAFFSDKKIARILRKELRVWNSNHQLAAIRDSRLDETASSQSWVRFGDLPNSWDATYEARIGDRVVPSAARNQPNLPIDLYGFMGVSLPDRPAPMGDWLSASSMSAREGVIHFRTRWAEQKGEAGDFTVDVVGNDVRVIEGAEIIQKEVGLCSVQRLPHASGVEWRRLPTPECGDGQQPDGYRLKLRARDSHSDIILAVTPRAMIPEQLRGVEEQERTFQPKMCRTEELQLRKNKLKTRERSADCEGRTGLVVHRGSDNVMALCQIRSPSSGSLSSDSKQKSARCTLAWEDQERRKPVKHGEIYVVSADQKPLTDEDGEGEITPLAMDLGLATLVGLSPADPFGLGAALWASTPEATQRTLQLTVDTRLQSAMQEVLVAELRRKKAKLAKGFEDQRRAVLLLMDLDEYDSPKGSESVSGNVLAVASQRAPELGQAMWNILGKDFWRPGYSPLAPLAWSRINGSVAPGSTFKVMTSLALIKKTAEEVESNGPLHRVLRGDLVGEGYGNPALRWPQDVALTRDKEGVVIPVSKYFGYVDEPCHASAKGRGTWRAKNKNNRSRVTTKRLCNYPGEDHAVHGKSTPGASGCPAVPNGQGQNQYGLCEAITTSVNSWFVLTSLALDGSATKDYVRGYPEDPTSQKDQETQKDQIRPPEFMSMANHLVPKAGTNMISRWPDKVRAARAARFRMQDGLVIGLDQENIDPLFTLAQNTIGQDVQVSPLSMAAVYGSIATGCRVTPRFADGGAAFGERATPSQSCAPIFFPADGRSRFEKDAKALMTHYLWPGLNAVINFKSGTAKTAFKGADYREHVFAKTGTADIDARSNQYPDAGLQSLNTAWLAGWVEKEGTGKLKRRIGFVCMITHVKGGAGGTGGAMCGPVVRKALDKLRTISLRETGSNNELEVAG